MLESSLALQKGIRAALVADAGVTDLVTATSIFDGRTRPENFPCVIMGEGQTVLEAITYARKHVRVYLDAHIWTKEAGLHDVKTIAGAVSTALALSPAIDDHALVDFMVTGTRFMRDPKEEYGHAIISIEALIQVAS
ncbi:DUF3168 domain-containing protein [Hoeflea sp. CAU 1731]